MTSLAHVLPATTPHLRLLSMPHDEHEPRDTLLTEVAPPSEDRDTQPPDPVEEAAANAKMSTMLPAPKAPTLNADGLVDEPSNMPELLYNQLMKAHHALEQQRDDLLNPDGPFAALVRTLVDGGADRVATKLEPRFAGIERELATAREDAAKAMRIASEALNRVTSLEAILSKQKP